MTAGRHAAAVDPADLLDHLLLVDHNVRELRYLVSDQSRTIAALEAVVATIPEIITRLSAAIDRIEAELRASDGAWTENEALRSQLADQLAAADTVRQQADVDATARAAAQIEPLVARLEALVPEEQPPA